MNSQPPPPGIQKSDHKGEGASPAAAGQRPQEKCDFAGKDQRDGGRQRLTDQTSRVEPAQSQREANAPAGTSRIWPGRNPRSCTPPPSPLGGNDPGAPSSGSTGREWLGDRGKERLACCVVWQGRDVSRDAVTRAVLCQVARRAVQRAASEGPVGSPDPEGIFGGI